MLNDVIELELHRASDQHRERIQERRQRCWQRDGIVLVVEIGSGAYRGRA
jgi:hypothetical protein